MGLTLVERNRLLDLTAVTHISVHTAAPGEGGANEVVGGTYARLPVTWAAASAGAKALSGTPYVFDVPSGSTITHVGLWTALSGGTYKGDIDIVDEVYGADGTYSFTAGSITMANA